MYNHTLSHSTVHVYLAAVRSLHALHGYDNPLEGKLMLKQAVKAFHILRGDSTQKLPITIDVMKRMHPVVMSLSDGKTLWASMTLAFFACLRASELTVQKYLDPKQHLTVSDVTLYDESDPPYASVLIKRSKTDTFNKGVLVFVGCTADPNLCAHCSLQSMVRKKRPDEPLFLCSNDTALSKYMFVNNTKLVLALLGYDVTKYSDHSYRAGAATTAAMIGMSDYEIKLLGRWKSRAYSSYIREPIPLLTSFSQRMYSYQTHS